MALIAVYLNKNLLKETGLAQKRNDIQERRDKELAEPLFSKCYREEKQ